MGEVDQEAVLLQFSDARFKSPLSINIHDSNTTLAIESNPSSQHQQNQLQHHHPNDEWLPITESRNGNAYFAVFHILNSNIGFQALMLPLSFATLGWTWGSVCLSLAYIWQFYTAFLLVELHESPSGIRRSRYLALTMSAFGEKLGKIAALFPLMYLSGGTCVMFIITGGRTMKQLFKILCEDDNGLQTCSARAPTGVEWFLVFITLAILIAQLPNLNSLASVSLIGAVAAISYCTLFWSLSVKKGRPMGVSYSSTLESHEPTFGKINDIINAIGIIALSFRGHNVLLEIQGTLPSNLKETSKETMRKALSISYILIATCVFPLAIVGFWAYGSQIPVGSTGGLLAAFSKFHKKEVTKFTIGAMYVLVILHCLTSFQVYAMVVFDNLEIKYTASKNKKCPQLVRTCIRLFFGGFTFFIAVTFPFLPSLAAFIGGMTLIPVTYAYPCFIWLVLEKPRTKGGIWFFNLVLGCLGMLLSVLVVAAALRTLIVKGLHVNFYKP